MNTDTWVRSSLVSQVRVVMIHIALHGSRVLRMSSHPRMWWAFLFDFELSILFIFLIFPFIFYLLHFLPHFFHFLEGRREPVHSAKKGMDSLDETYSLTVFSALRVYLPFSLCVVSPDNCLTAQTCAPATDRNLESDCVMIWPISTAREKVPFSHTSAHGSGACCCDHGTRESPWVLWYVAGIWMEELAQRLQQLETQVGQQRAVIEHQQEQLMRQQTTIDVERAARTPVNPAQDARINLVDLRVGNKLETFAGETH